MLLYLTGAYVRCCFLCWTEWNGYQVKHQIAVRTVALVAVVHRAAATSWCTIHATLPRNSGPRPGFSHWLELQESSMPNDVLCSNLVSQLLELTVYENPCLVNWEQLTVGQFSLIVVFSSFGIAFSAFTLSLSVEWPVENLCHFSSGYILEQLKDENCRGILLPNIRHFSGH